MMWRSSPAGVSCPVPKPAPTSWIVLDDKTIVWLRRLFTDPTGRDLVALDSVRRRFEGGLRRFLELRDPTCRVPWCDAPAVQADHTQAHAHGGATDAGNGAGLCQRHNLVKEMAGWHVAGRVHRTRRHRRRTRCVSQTPSGRVHDSTAPPILGEGWVTTASTRRTQARK